MELILCTAQCLQLTILYCTLKNLLEGRTYVFLSHTKIITNKEGRRKLLEVLDMFMAQTVMTIAWIKLYTSNVQVFAYHTSISNSKKKTWNVVILTQILLSSNRLFPSDHACLPGLSLQFSLTNSLDNRIQLVSPNLILCHLVIFACSICLFNYSHCLALYSRIHQKAH